MKKTTTFKRCTLILLAVMMIASLSVMSACEGAVTDTGGGESATIAALKGLNINEDPIKIAIIPLSTAGVTNKMYKYACDSVIKFYPNVELKYFDAGYDPNKQVEIINECITQKYNAIILEAMDPVATKGPVEDAEANGIPVITFNIGSNGIHSLHIQGSDYLSGREAAQVVAEAIGNKGAVVSLDGPAAQAETNEMAVGFQDEIKDNYPDIEFIENVYTENWDAAIGKTNMAALLAQHDKIDAVFCSSDDIAGGAIAAIQAAGRQDEIIVYGSMCYPDALVRIRDGNQFGSYFSDSYTELQTAMYQALYYIENGLNAVVLGYAETPTLNQPTVSTTKANVDNIINVSRWQDADPEAWQ
jgi:ABC-type sugar transport system substrate-binding protein